MINMTRYYDQHKDLTELVMKISSQLNTENLKKNATEVRMMLASLSGKLKLHLANEDKVIYPMLLKNEDENVRKTAQRFIDEIGNIAKALVAYLENWPNDLRIQENPSGFATETTTIFKALAERISKEDNELYPLVEKINNS